MRRRKTSKRGGRARVKKGGQGRTDEVISTPSCELESVGDGDLSKDGSGTSESETMHTGFMQTGPKSYRCGSTQIELDGADEDITVSFKTNDIALEVECGENKAMMYLSKLYQGSKGHCIEFQGSWITPNEFQAVSGRESAKDWKRSIRHHGRSLKLLLSKGIIDVHPAACRCDSCRLLQQSNGKTPSVDGLSGDEAKKNSNGSPPKKKKITKDKERESKKANGGAEPEEEISLPVPTGTGDKETNTSSDTESSSEDEDSSDDATDEEDDDDDDERKTPVKRSKSGTETPETKTETKRVEALKVKIPRNITKPDPSSSSDSSSSDASSDGDSDDDSDGKDDNDESSDEDSDQTEITPIDPEKLNEPLFPDIKPKLPKAALKPREDSSSSEDDEPLANINRKQQHHLPKPEVTEKADDAKKSAFVIPAVSSAENNPPAIPTAPHRGVTIDDSELLKAKPTSPVPDTTAEAFLEEMTPLVSENNNHIDETDNESEDVDLGIEATPPEKCLEEIKTEVVVPADTLQPVASPEVLHTFTDSVNEKVESPESNPPPAEISSDAAPLLEPDAADAKPTEEVADSGSLASDARKSPFDPERTGTLEVPPLVSTVPKLDRKPSGNKLSRLSNIIDNLRTTKEKQVKSGSEGEQSDGSEPKVSPRILSPKSSTPSLPPLRSEIRTEVRSEEKKKPSAWLDSTSCSQALIAPPPLASDAAPAAVAASFPIL